MPFEADILIAQSTFDYGSSVSALAIGWQVRPPQPLPWGLIVVLRATRDLIGTQHRFKVEMEREGEDGPEVIDLGQEGGPAVTAEAVEEAAEIAGDFEVTGREDLKGPVVLSYGFNLLPVPLPPEREYRFRLWVDDETRDHWVAHFRTSGEFE
jgi:hypothetical protein